MKKITLLTFLLSSFVALGQNKKDNKQTQKRAFFPVSNEVNSSEKGQYVRCATVEYENYLRSIDPNRQTEAEFEAWLAPLVKKHLEEMSNGKSIDAVYNIPVVIHIIHNGDCIGEGENITDAQAISQITVMNEDYRRIGTRGGANTTGLAVDSEINFILAKRDPSGNPTTGVVRHLINPYTNNVADGAGGADWENKPDVEAMKQATIWDPTKYLNMWVIRPGGLDLASGGLSGLLGYAQFPQGSTLTGITAGTVANTDGVVAAFDAMGTDDLDDGSFMLNPSYNLGRTMTHEVGHWLGLRHIWGDNSTCPATNTDADKDYCSDTPAANGPNYSCNLSANTCPTTAGNDQVQNYMDYTNDACMDTFTAKQKARMQTCMANALRRNSLNTSNGATAPSAGIYFNYQKSYCSVNEGTGCNYTDVNYKLSIIKAPTANAVVTFTVDGTSTATNNLDFQIMTPTVTFASGSTADQTFTVRYFGDGISESLETAKFGFTVNANGGDGSIITENSTLNINIVDNDVAPPVSYSVNALSEDFESATPALGGIKDLDGDTYNWGIYTGLNVGFTGNSAASRSWISGVGGLNPDNIIYTQNTITVPTNANLSFRIGTSQAAPYHLEHYSVYLTTINPSTFTTATLNAVTPLINNQVLAAGASSTVINTSIAAYAGQTVYLVFRHHNTYDMNIIAIDDISISSSGTTQVQTAINNPTKYQAYVPQAGTFYAVDNTTGNVMLDGTADAFNYGCTSVEVNRDLATAGAAAVNYGSNTANNLKVMAKTYLVTPTNASTSGSCTFKFYFTETEVAAWEAATGNTRSNLRVFKNGETSTYATTLGAFGAHVTLTATSPTGLGGTYYFGTVNTLLASDSFDYINEVSLYPNPSNDFVNVNLPAGLENGKIEIYNSLGQKIDVKNINSSDNLNINVSNYSNGVYFFNLTFGQATKTIKFVKK